MFGGKDSAFRDESSHVIKDTQLSKVPIIDDTILSSYTLEHEPTNNLNEGNILEVTVPASNNYIRLNEITLHGSFKVIKTPVANPSTEENLDENDDISVCNLSSCALWKLVSLHMNGIETTDRSHFRYSYKAYIETLLNNTEENKDTYLKEFSLWYPDTAGKETGPNNLKKDGENSGYTNRAALISKSKTVEFFSKIHLDALTTQKLLLNGITLKFTFHRNSDNAVLISPSAWTTHIPKIKIMSLKVKVPYVVMNTKKIESDATKLRQEAFLYTFPMTRVSTQDIPRQSTGVITRPLGQGVLPNLIVLAFTKASKMEDLKENPFYFNHEDLSRLYFCIDGQIVSPVRDVIDFSNNKCLDLYFNLVRTLRLDDPHQPIKITLESFKSGTMLIAKDIHGCCSGGQNHFHSAVRGSLDVNLSFKNAPNDTLALMAFSVFNAAFSVDKDRRVELFTP